MMVAVIAVGSVHVATEVRDDVLMSVIMIMIAIGTMHVLRGGLCSGLSARSVVGRCHAN